jgi:hypothetical protein
MGGIHAFWIIDVTFSEKGLLCQSYDDP